MIPIQTRPISLRVGLLLLALTFALPWSQPATAQPATDSSLQISWEVRNRFRLFREERDFQLQVEALRNGSVLAAEDALAVQSDGRG